MAVLGRGSDRPAAVRPKASRRTAADGFFVSRGMPPPLRQGKKAGLAVAGRRSRHSRPSGPDPSIRGCVGTDPSNRPMETNMTAVVVDAQRPGIADRIKTCARASTSKTARPGERRRKTAERSAPRGAGSERPGGCMGPVSGSGMTAPTSINSLVTGSGGDDRFTLVPARRADLIPRDRRPRIRERA